MGLMRKAIRRSVPRSVRRPYTAVRHPVRTSVRAVTPRPVRQLERGIWQASHPFSAMESAAENALLDAVMGRGGTRTRRPASVRAVSSGPNSYAAAVERAELGAVITQYEAQLLAKHLAPVSYAEPSTAPAPSQVDPRGLRSKLERERGASKFASEIGHYGEPPTAPDPDPVDVGAIERRLWSETSSTVPAWKLRARRALHDQLRAKAHDRAVAEEEQQQQDRAQLQCRLDARWSELQALRQQIAAEVDAWVASETSRRAAAQRLAQGLLNIQWQRLQAGEPEAVHAAVRTALTESAVTPLGCAGSTVVLVVAIADRDELIGDQEPAYTQAGRPTVRKRTQTRMNDLYVAAMASRLLGAGRRAAAAAPAIEEVFIIGIVPVDDAEEWEAVYEGAFTRDYLLTRVGAIPNQVGPLTDALDDAEDAAWGVVGRTRELGTLDTDDDPGLAAVISRMKRAVRAQGASTQNEDAAAVRQLFRIEDESDEEAERNWHAATDHVGSAPSDTPVTPHAATYPQERNSETATGSRTAGKLGGHTTAVSTAQDTELLISTLGDGDSDLRYEAVTALRDRLSPELRDAFLKATRDSDTYVRRVAIDAIAELDNHRRHG